MKQLNFLFFLIGFVFIGVGQETGSFTDHRDGKTYNTVKIGKQIWMAENLAFKPGKGNYWAFDGWQSNLERYGYLYDWETARNVCPPGWRLPSDNEWQELIDFLGGNQVAGFKMKSESGWHQVGLSGNGNGDNSSGFNGLPGGSLALWDNRENFNFLREAGFWWSSTPSEENKAWFRYIRNRNTEVERGSVVIENGQSVRCLKN